MAFTSKQKAEGTLVRIPKASIDYYGLQKLCQCSESRTETQCKTWHGYSDVIQEANIQQHAIFVLISSTFKSGFILNAQQ